jgi:UDP-N-acetylmuramate dehydrogenase
VKWGLGPAEFFAGIPGTLGGALAMNAGAWGGETWQHVVEVDVLDRRGVGARAARGIHDRLSQRRRSRRRMVHRRAPRVRAPARRERDAIRELLERAAQTQPIGEWSCGSVFTNPPGDHAARLIETAGLKGFRIGDASVSLKARQFHHQSRRGERRRHRGGDPARAAHDRSDAPRRAAARSAHRRSPA